MRVALISPLFESVPPRFYGGTERVVHNLAWGLSESGVDVTVFASGDSQVRGRLVPVIDEALRLRSVPVRDAFAYNLKMLGEVARNAHSFDVIHNHHDYWMLPLSEMTDVPVLSTLHGRLDLPDISEAFHAFRRSHFVSISEAQARLMPSLNWVRTIHHGMDFSTYHYHPGPGRYLAFLGRISPEKRPDWAIRIAHESGVPLKIAAKIEGQEGRDYYEAAIKPHVDGTFIEYIGEISEGEKAAFLGNAMALAFPIDWPEPFGLVMLESLACGTPVLARPCGSVPEVLKDGVTGFIRSDVTDLARTVQDLPSISRQACREWVETRFSRRRMTEDYLHVYRRLSQSSRHGSVRARAG